MPDTYDAPISLTGVYVFAHEHAWPATLTEPDEIEDATDGINGDFLRCRANADAIAARLVKLLTESVGDCLGCRNVACRITMLIEDLEIEVGDHGDAAA
jgi:hypothetical protein